MNRRRLVSSLVIIVVAVGLCSCSQDSGTATSTSAATSDTAQLAAAAGRAREWLAAQGDALPPYVFLVADYMRRRFGTELPAGGDLVAKAAPEGPAVQAEMRVYSRLVDPSVAIGPDGLAALTDEVDVLTAPALACDQVRLPSGYLDLLQKAVEKGGYERTHAVLALRWLVEHDCIGAEEADRLSQDWADALVRTVEERRAEGDAGGDLAIEAMAMLAYTGHADRIAADWMDDVISAQRLDGAWQQHVSGTDAPSAHATVLALWLLLELSHPGTQPTPWIPDP